MVLPIVRVLLLELDSPSSADLLLDSESEKERLEDPADSSAWH